MTRPSAASQFGMAVRRHRRSHKLTQQQLAERVGNISVSYVSNVEGGRKNLTLSQCARFAQALKLPLLAFFLDEVPHARPRRTAAAR